MDEAKEPIWCACENSDGWVLCCPQCKEIIVTPYKVLNEKGWDYILEKCSCGQVLARGDADGNEH